MFFPPQGYAVVFQSRQRFACRDALLVLESMQIPVRLDQAESTWYLSVPAHHASEAVAELDAYQQEQPAGDADRHGDPPTAGVRYPGMGSGITGYVTCLLSFAYLSGLPSHGSPWVVLGGMQAEAVATQHQWWRTITALTLHVDVGHLMSNLGFGCLFGWMASRLFGGGLAWGGILIGGATGNLLNALLRDPTHQSIGASTAVFAALGMVVADGLGFRQRIDQNVLKRWSPLIAGLVLFGLLGLGDQRTDVLAHATGFVAGLPIGWLANKVPATVRQRKLTQILLGGVSVVIIVIAWLFAVSHWTVTSKM